MEQVDIEEHFDTVVPLTLGFQNEAGVPTMLRDYFDGKRPVVITLNYSDCPQLCSMQLSQFVKSLAQVELSAGEDFQILTISLDPSEKPARAAQTKDRYLSQYGREGAADGWHFLTGSQNNIKAMADAVGFKYAYNPSRDEYAHPAAIAMLTPDGRIARYLYGLDFHPRTLRLALVESSEGKIGTAVDRFILSCFHWDSTEGDYTFHAWTAMRAGGVLTVLVLGGTLMGFFRKEARKRRDSKS
jgi:protein SCO1